MFLDRFGSNKYFVEALLQTMRHICYIAFDCLFFSRNSLRPCIALYLTFRRAQYTKHDFCVLKFRLISKIDQIQGMQLHIFAAFLSNCVRQQKFKSRLTSRSIFKKFSCIPPVIDSIRLLRMSGIGSKTQRASTTLNLGGGSASSGSKLYNFSVIRDYLVSVPRDVNRKSMFRYVAHVDDVGLLAYSSAQFVHADIPLSDLFKFLPISHARNIALVHCIPAGSRCNKAELLMLVQNHSCLRCTSHFTIFSVEMNKTPAIKIENKVINENTGPEESMVSKFPPDPADDDITRAILSNVCKKMHPKAIEEAGCAVCGELKPLQTMSRLKSVKNILGVLEAPGVTRVERSTDTKIKEYGGPVLDYACSHICDTCRKSIRNGKVPRLALANNLWIGKVPDQLKKLRFVEKILIARVRHTCAYVKVASGMRKMKANVVAFESPIPKIYSVLPPPREDLDEVLAILFTGPSKPTSEDFSRTPFLVRRNAVIAALEWLKLNHADYAKIEISRKNMDQYDEVMPPVSIEYRESVTNKVPEGTSVFDQEEEEGTEKGDCAFAVHGLTGEILNSMSPNAMKVLALRHLNSNGKILAVGHSDKLESMWNNPQLYPQMFPWLFPYGLGGVGASKISHKEHKRHLLMYHDKRFQTDVNFPFVAFSHEQMMSSTTQSFLLVDQSRFVDISQRLMNLDWSALDNLTKKLEAEEHVAPSTDAEKLCFQVIKDLDAVSGKMHGSTVTKKFMRNEIWSLINHLGAPCWYITLSPADIQHPICVYYAGSELNFKPNLLTPYDERMRSVCRNPVAGARFFHFMVETFITDVLGVVKGGHRGFYGNTGGYYGTVEQQGRLTLHLHMLLWITGSLNPGDMREKILKNDSIWQRNLIDWLESCHTGDFLTGTYTDINETMVKEREKKGYVDPTQSLPVPPPKKCRKIHNETDNDKCKECRAIVEWTDCYSTTVDDLLLRSNVHDCNRGSNKDGSRRKNKASGGCMNNKWGKCKARFPRPTFLKTVIDEFGSITLKKIEAWLNTFTPLVTYLFRCNTDVTSLSSGTAIKAVVLYVSDYITKSTLKTHTIFDSIKSVFQKNSDMIGGTLPMKEKARRFMTKVANLLSAKAEMGAPMICMYLLGNPDHYTSHIFVPFYWQMYVAEVRRHFDTDGVLQPQKVALIKKNGRLVGISPVHDYIHRASELDHVNLFEWIKSYKREKLRGRKKKAPSEDNNEMLTDDDCEQVMDADESELSFQSAPLVDDDETADKPSKNSKNVFRFKTEHPLHGTHAMHLVRDNSRRVPNFAGANLPRRDKGDREYYCCTMLTVFKPWRRGSDLKESGTSSWEDAFRGHGFRGNEIDMMNNFNIRYECLDARDDFRAQLKKGAATNLFGSWETLDDNVDDRPDTDGPIIEFDDVPSDPLGLGQKQMRRLKEMEMVKDMLSATGWTDPVLGSPNERPDFRPNKKFSGREWEQEVDKEKQRILEKKNLHNAPRIVASAGEQGPLQEGIVQTANVVKVVDKAYFERKFHVEGLSNAIDDIVEKFSLNSDQERAFRIISNHAIGTDMEQLRMYLGGMGGTGKSQVIKALSSFFEARHEAHRFIIVAPTGTAAALLGGSTYHSMFGINDRMTSNKIGHVKARLNGVDYVFFDEVSMLSARDLYRINAQLAKVFGISDVPFGGLNMVFCGDFAQLPPAVGGEHVSLYSRTIGAFATDKKSQEEAIGKALWHQITRVVILRQNMRQKNQSPEDASLRTALENMRYKSCTAADISFLRTRISSTHPDGDDHPSICESNFRDVSIITGTNLQKDEINRLGALRYAQETNQVLTDFYSDDSPRVHSTDADARTSNTKRVAEIPDEMQKALWDQQPSSTDKQIAGKLTLCLGLPVMIRHNYATEICMTRGQEGYVVGWQSKTGSKGQRTLDTLFIELKNPPAEIHIDGLPKNIVPLYPTTNSIQVYLPNDERYYISRTQVEVLVNFAMTDFGSQGKTRPYNVTYLNNLSSHQGYYTALSRSATASGTLILQGFDAKKITGGCSGALRQEFRELELLDDITSVSYAGKLPATVCGVTRNNIIQAFRAWKGDQYVPKLVHPVIRWSKRDPLPESCVYDLKESMAVNTTTAMKKKRTISELQPEGQIENDYEEDMPVTKKRRRHGPTTAASAVAPSTVTYIVPVGMVWSQNSCAYDSIFTIIFAIWCNDKDKWNRYFYETGNKFSILLADQFSKYDIKLISLEKARDKVRKELSKVFPNLKFGSYTSLEYIFDAMFTTDEVIYETRCRCPSNHGDLYSEEYKLYMSKACAPFLSTSEWMRINSYDATNSCRTCGQAVDIETAFVTAPPLMILEFSNSSIEIDHCLEIKLSDEIHKYNLAGVVYYKEEHFVSNVITADNQLWFYDGLTSGSHLVYSGSLASCQQLTTCRGGSASAAFYVRVCMT
jgi:uncharacterized protein DUF6570/helitron helicase-like protein/PIF1-like helicase